MAQLSGLTPECPVRFLPWVRVGKWGWEAQLDLEAQPH